MGKLAHLLERDSPPVKQMEAQVQSMRLRDADWKSMLAEVDSQLTDLHEHLDMVEKEAAEREEAYCARMDKMSGEMDSLRAAVSALVTRSALEIKQAVGGIKMPVMPEQMKTDLTPVLRAIDALASLERGDGKPVPAEKPEEWIFDVQRGPNGGITRVVAKEV